MDIVRFRGKEETGENMKRLSHAKWSEVLYRTVWEAYKRTLSQYRLEEAAKTTDDLRRTSSVCNGADETRRWRDH
jgi:hypothetical protein